FRWYHGGRFPGHRFATRRQGERMSETPRPTVEELARQARQHLESLRAAGVEWLPNAPLQVAVAASPPPVASVAPAPSLFAEEVAGCTRCAELASTRTQTVFGVGKLDAEVCFIGEAPGADEDRQGEPFVGPAGQLLNRIIVACGMKREEVYICNILRCRPPGN